MPGKTLSLKGDLDASEDLTIDWTLEGSITCEGRSVVLGSSADVTGDIVAGSITVLGRTAGQLTATEVVDIRAGATVTGRVFSKRFILDAGATFNGRVEPQHLEEALSVAKFRQRQRDSAE